MSIIIENDVVELAVDVARWPAGTRGTVVSDHGASDLVEISDEQGQMLALIEIPEVKLKLVARPAAF